MGGIHTLTPIHSQTFFRINKTCRATAQLLHELQLDLGRFRVLFSPVLYSCFYLKIPDFPPRKHLNKMQTTSIVLLSLALLESGRVGTGAIVSHVKPSSPVPMEFQVDCGTAGEKCDGRTQFCATEVMPSCEDCADDMCAFTEHKDYDATMYQCEEHCPGEF